jgi:collagen type III alpha
MNQSDIAALMRGIAPAVRDIVAKGLDSLSDRIKALEERAPAKGEKGDPGKDGEPGTVGADGVNGHDGKDGSPGQDGKDGLSGSDGKDGADGLEGKQGLEGKEGLAGRDGRDGLPGVQGEKGFDGKDGRDGIDGQDGFGLDDFDVRSDDDGRTLVFSFAREGREPVTRTIKTAIVLDRGVWRETSFEKGDSVTWAGSSFIAQRDTSDKPETSDAWRLAVKRGRDGKEGRPGPQGEKGLKGDSGTPGRNY